MKHALFAALVCVFFITPATAQVRKCTGADGRVTYSDFVCASTTAKETGVVTNSNTLDGSGMRKQAKSDRNTAAGDQAVMEKGEQCKFTRYGLGKGVGAMLADAATKECLDNLRAKAIGQPVFFEAFNRWKEAKIASDAQSAADGTRAALNNLQNKSYQCTPNPFGTSMNCR